MILFLPSVMHVWSKKLFKSSASIIKFVKWFCVKFLIPILQFYALLIWISAKVNGATRYLKKLLFVFYFSIGKCFLPSYCEVKPVQTRSWQQDRKYFVTTQVISFGIFLVLSYLKLCFRSKWRSVSAKVSTTQTIGSVHFCCCQTTELWIT